MVPISQSDFWNVLSLVFISYRNAKDPKGRGTRFIMNDYNRRQYQYEKIR